MQCDHISFVRFCTRSRRRTYKKCLLAHLALLSCFLPDTQTLCTELLPFNPNMFDFRQMRKKSEMICKAIMQQSVPIHFHLSTRRRVGDLPATALPFLPRTVSDIFAL